MKLNIIGLRLEKFLTNGEYSDGEYDSADTIEENRYILYCIGDYNNKYEITLWNTYGECGSGWCGASWGNIKIDIVTEFANKTHIPINKLSIYIDVDNYNNYEDEEDCNIHNEVFSYSEVGGDGYYPCGSISVNIDLFKPTIRSIEKRPVWLFKGNSNLGKSYLGHKINKDKFVNVYETDSSDCLPSKIKESIIILGNKYNYSVEEINNKIFGEHELIVVDFNKFM